MAIITSFSRGHGMALFLVLFNRCRVPLFPVPESPSALSEREPLTTLCQTCPRQPGGSSVSTFEGGSAWSLGFPFPQPIRLCKPGLTFCYELAGQRWIEVLCYSPLLKAKDGVELSFQDLQSNTFPLCYLAKPATSCAKVKRWPSRMESNSRFSLLATLILKAYSLTSLSGRVRSVAKILLCKKGLHSYRAEGKDRLRGKLHKQYIDLLLQEGARCGSIAFVTIKAVEDSAATTAPASLGGTPAQGDFTRCQLGGLWTFVALHGTFGLICFMLHRACSIGQSGWFFAPSFGVVAIFRFILFFQGFHSWTLNPFHMMGVAGVLGAALLYAIHGAIVENTLFENGDGANTFRAFNPTQAEETVGIRAALYASPSTSIHATNSSASDRDASPFCVLKTVQN
ncbi:hypothetical protein M9H77_08259 [Catharanthus roseus]|uniref:Uncharacterized protein n=1 Tax=Catharanthus roseus TaxID=4058 RepID=A0ACC0BXJ7_CATRO|nr:hypothetical protein M9H77_08259 [Catharanthus roseus]